MTDKETRGWQRWFWQADATTGQKWVLMILLALVLGALAPMLLERSFVPSATWQQIAWYVVMTLALAMMAGLWHLHRTGQWQPAGMWLTAGALKRAMLMVGVLLFLVMLLWMNVAHTFPVAYTKLWGNEAYEKTFASPKKSSGRYSCHHQIQFEEIRYIFFEFCISAEDFETLPEEPQPALLTVKQSFFGRDVQSVQMVAFEQAAQSTTEAAEDAR